MPLRLVGHGKDDLPISRLLMIMTTEYCDNCGTDDTINLSITVDGTKVVDFDIGDTPQRDQEEGQANLYFAPVRSQFRLRDLSEDSIVLSTSGLIFGCWKGSFSSALTARLKTRGPRAFSQFPRPTVLVEQRPQRREGIYSSANSRKSLSGALRAYRRISSQSKGAHALSSNGSSPSVSRTLVTPRSLRSMNVPVVGYGGPADTYHTAILGPFGARTHSVSREIDAYDCSRGFPWQR